MLECSLVEDNSDFASILKRILSWFYDMQGAYQGLHLEESIVERKLVVRETIMFLPKSPLVVVLVVIVVVTLKVGCGVWMARSGQRRTY